MKKVIYMAAMVLMLGGVSAEGMGKQSSLEKRRVVWKEIEGEEVWRKELGRERCLLLYIDETGEMEMVFTDGLWPYMTEAITERLEEAGVELWKRENGLQKENEKS